MTRAELERIVAEFLDAQTTVTLAGSIDDRPWTAAVYYARQGFDLVFFSSTRSRHSTIFQQNPRAAGAVHGIYTTWKEIKGLQMEGTVEKITGVRARARALATYLKRYPFAAEFFTDPGALSPKIAEKMARVALYMFRPEAILHMDNSTGFGTRWKLGIEGGKAVGEPVSA